MFINGKLLGRGNTHILMNGDIVGLKDEQRVQNPSDRIGFTFVELNNDIKRKRQIQEMEGYKSALEARMQEKIRSEKAAIEEKMQRSQRELEQMQEEQKASAVKIKEIEEKAKQ